MRNMRKINNKKEICVKLTTKTPEQRVVPLLFTDFARSFGVSILDFEQVSNSWIVFPFLFCNGMTMQFLREIGFRQQGL